MAQDGEDLSWNLGERGPAKAWYALINCFFLLGLSISNFSLLRPPRDGMSEPVTGERSFAYKSQRWLRLKALAGNSQNNISQTHSCAGYNPQRPLTVAVISESSLLSLDHTSPGKATAFINWESGSWIEAASRWRGFILLRWFRAIQLTHRPLKSLFCI